MKNILAGVILLLCAATAGAQDTHNLYLAMVGDLSNCIGAVVTIGGSTYTVRQTNGQLFGPTSEAFDLGAQVSVTPRWFEGDACPGATADFCATRVLTLGLGIKPVCSVPSGNGSRDVNFEVQQYGTGTQSYWKIVVTAKTSGAPLPQN
jgi:hypothetical protein